MHGTAVDPRAGRPVLLACAIAGLAGLMLAGCGNAPLPRAVSTRAVAGSPVPASAIPRLRAMAGRLVRMDAQVAPARVSVVATTRQKALTSATPGDTVPGAAKTIVYLLTMRGRFTAGSAPGPPGAPAPAGRYLSVVIDARTFQGLDFGLSPKPPPVAPGSLGPVTYLTGLAGPSPARPAVRDTVRCVPSQVRLAAGPAVSERTQQSTLLVEIRNISATGCGLRGYPGIVLAGRGGARLPFRYRRGGDQMLTGRAPALVPLSPGAVAYLAINKNHCVTFTRRIASRLEVTLPGDRQPVSLRLARYPILDYCGRNDPGHTIDVTPVEPAAAQVLRGR
jgi:uncharacterized protein DUF4232